MLEKRPGFVGLLHQVLSVGDKHNWVDDAVVIKEHASDLTGGLAVGSLNDAVDGVTDLLASLTCIHLLKACSVNLRHESLLLLVHHLLLLLLLKHGGLRISWLSLHLLGHLLLGRGHAGGHLLGLSLLLWLSDIAAVAVSTLSLILSVSTTVVVVLVPLVSTLALIPLALMVAVTLLAVTSTVHVRASFLVTAHLVHLTIEQVLHKILLHFVKAS